MGTDPLYLLASRACLADVLQLLQSSKRQRGEQPAPAAQQLRRCLGLHRLTKREEEEAAAATAGEPAAPTAVPAPGPVPAVAPVAAAAGPQRRRPQLELMATTPLQTDAAAASADNVQLAPPVVDANAAPPADVRGAASPALASAGVQHISPAASTGVGRKSVGVQVWTPAAAAAAAVAGAQLTFLPAQPLPVSMQATGFTPGSRSVDVQAGVVPHAAAAGTEGLHSTSPQQVLPASSPPPARQTAALSARREAAAAGVVPPAGSPAASEGDSSDSSDAPPAPGGVTPSRFAPRGGLRPVRLVQEWREGGLAVGQLPPGLCPTRIEADKEGAAAAQRRLEQAHQREQEQQQQQKAAAAAAGHGKHPKPQQAAAPASTAELVQQQREEAAAAQRQRREQQRRDKQGKQAGRQGKAGGGGARQAVAAAPTAAPAAQATARPAPAGAAAAAGKVGTKRGRSLGGEAAQAGGGGIQCSPVILAAQAKIRAAQAARRQQAARVAGQLAPSPVHQALQKQAGLGSSPLVQHHAKRQRTAPQHLAPQQQQQQQPPRAQRVVSPLRPSLKPAVAAVAPPRPVVRQQQQHAAGGWRPSGPPPPPAPAAPPLNPHKAPPAGGRRIVQRGPASRPAAPGLQQAALYTPRGPMPAAWLHAAAAAVELTPEQVRQLPTRPNMRPSGIRNPFWTR